MLFDWYDDSGHHPDRLLVVDVNVLGVTARGPPSTLNPADLWNEDRSNIPSPPILSHCRFTNIFDTQQISDIQTVADFCSVVTIEYY